MEEAGANEQAGHQKLGLYFDDYAKLDVCISCAKTHLFKFLNE